MSTEQPYTLGDYFDVVRRRWIYMVTIFPAALMIAIYIAYTLPPMYRSSGTIMLEGPAIPQDMIRATVTTPIESLQRSVITVDNLMGLVEEYDPYPNLVDLNVDRKARLLSQDIVIERVDPVTLQPAPASNTFSVHYYNPDPARAAGVAERLVDLFLNYGRETRARGAGEVHEFLLVQSREVLAEIASLEAELADFRAEHGDAFPEAQLRNQQALDRTVRELDSVQQQIRAAQERRRLLEVQISQINPYLFNPEGDWITELAALRAELAEARQRYTDDHPTVRRLRRAIDGMSARAEAAGAMEQSAPPDNPAYLQVASQLDAVNEEIASLRTIESRARRQIVDYESSFQMAPDVERRYRQLTRDHETAQARYQQIEANLREAAMSQRLETEQRGERFTLIRAPGRPSAPDSPNRLGIILLGFVLGAALAAGLAALTESADPSIRSPRDLADITDIKPLGAVPLILNPADRRKRVFAWTAAFLIAAAAITFISTTVAQAFAG